MSPDHHNGRNLKIQEVCIPSIPTPSTPQRGASSSSKMGLSGHGGHNLPAVLWHALDVWQCTRQGYESLQEAMEDFLNCSTTFHTENW